jgi:hypothetical protein
MGVSHIMRTQVVSVHGSSEGLVEWLSFRAMGQGYRLEREGLLICAMTK